MAQNTSISLGDHFSKFITEQVSSGRYATSSDVIRSGLRLLEQEEASQITYSAEQLAGLDKAIAQADAGEFATTEEVQAVFAKFSA